MTLAYTSAHKELPYLDRAGLLRAAVLGANDGMVSVSSLIVGVAAADPSPTAALVAGAAGLAAAVPFAAALPVCCRSAYRRSPGCGLRSIRVTSDQICSGLPSHDTQICAAHGEGSAVGYR